MLASQLQQYVHLSRYARWREESNRRETWEETVTRYCDFFDQRFPTVYPYQRIWQAIVNLDVMPSMRAMMTAGTALERDEIAGYNCSFSAVDHPRAFDEILYVLMCGTGAGFSVEMKHVNELPPVPNDLQDSNVTIMVRDSKIGWATAMHELVGQLFQGFVPKWDVSRVRPAGARLKTFGGRASGPEPLVDLFNFTIKTFMGAKGRKLTSLECHDLVCKIADVVVVGGVRRSALISLSDLSDDNMRDAKSGAWWEQDIQRQLANNSAAYSARPNIGVFFNEWHALYKSKSGERGIFNRAAARRKAAENGRREVAEFEYGTNPCGEIILRPNGLCNLSEVVVRAHDTPSSLAEKVELATIIGTFQSTLTNFRYVRPIWQRNAEEERLLGVSMTGIMDNATLAGKEGSQVLADLLKALRHHSIKTNAAWADRLGIRASAAITTVKPSGTVSQLVDSASGIHPRYAMHYIRTVRADKKDPLAHFMRAKGFPVEDCIRKPDSVDVFSFPVAVDSNSVTRNDMSAIDQLEHYLLFKNHWCEHNPSITVYVRDNEWLGVGDWVYNHFDDIGGVSFLPHSDHVYPQAPYQEVDEATYLALKAKMPAVDWTGLGEFETEDQTTGTQELACVSGACEL